MLRLFCVSLLFNFPLSTLHSPLSTLHSLQAQEPVAPVTHWLATVDRATQQIVLRWSPSADSATMGYQICTGDSSLSYDSVFGRFDTTYVCLDHSPQERHTYRLYVFDSSHRVSSMTPHFGNVVLEADIPDCDTLVSAHWNPYEGIPDDTNTLSLRYIFWQWLEPFDSTFVSNFTTTHGAPMEHSFGISESVTRVWLLVEVSRDEDNFHSYSNIVMVERHTSDTASVVAISDITYDSVHTAIDLTFEVDTAFEYTLYRSVDGTPWRRVDSFHPHQSPYRYSDTGINPYDSLHCYQLEVKDACGLNPHYSNTAWVVVPDPPPPFITIPNAIVAGDDLNGTFLPRIQGLRGDLYELFIYNRMGLLVYHTTDQDAGWRPSASTPQGAYTYFLRCSYNTDDTKSYSGTIIVIK